ncbi:hypothetical protein CCZ01_07375 [Helicobacter monodelphidis]|uniref:DUF6033 family protein n=1 Tax=Helicobacter sp. 15-1451 TaxID=2004995 RepID=UPI000DCEFB8D|nr:DUF6033 family protein [Helicobacter sp. 15-1451]RAX57059.1 hypothetical protein CCZ01_07375 [Helicobacter sp. 15-1451]
MKASLNKAIQSYTAGLQQKTTSQAAEYLQGLKSRFPSLNISVQIPSSSSLFESSGNNHFMLPAGILQKMARDSEFSARIEADMRVFEAQIYKDQKNTSLESSGFFVNLDSSYGGWSIAKSVQAASPQDYFRQEQHQKEEAYFEHLESQGRDTKYERSILKKVLNRKLTIEDGRIKESSIPIQERRSMQQDTLDIRV